MSDVGCLQRYSIERLDSGSLLALLRVLVLGFLTSTEVFPVLKVSKEIMEFVFHQFTLSLISYHREAVSGPEFLLMG